MKGVSLKDYNLVHYEKNEQINKILERFRYNVFIFQLGACESIANFGVQGNAGMKSINSGVIYYFACFLPLVSPLLPTDRL